MNFTIITHPNSKNPRVERDLLNTIHVYVKEPPLEGRANNAVQLALVSYLKIKKSQLTLTSGAKSKFKTFEIRQN